MIDRQRDKHPVYIEAATGSASELHAWLRREADGKWHYPNSVTHGPADGQYVAKFRTLTERRAFLRDFDNYTSPAPWHGTQCRFSNTPHQPVNDDRMPVYIGTPLPAELQVGQASDFRAVTFEDDSPRRNDSSSIVRSRRGGVAAAVNVVDCTDEPTQENSSSSGKVRKRTTSPGNRTSSSSSSSRSGRGSSLAAAVEEGTTSRESSPPTKKTKAPSGNLAGHSAEHWIRVSHPPARGGFTSPADPFSVWTPHPPVPVPSALLSGTGGGG